MIDLQAVLEDKESQLEKITAIWHDNNKNFEEY
jgi:hypothetical protein